MTNTGHSLGSLTGPDHLEFVGNSYRVILGRMPTQLEQDAMLSGLMRGDAKTWLLGALRYGKEGRARRVSIAGLRLRYLAQCAFRAPGLGPLLSWLNAALRLPQALRYFRAAEQAASDERQCMDLFSRHVYVALPRPA